MVMQEVGEEVPAFSTVVQTVPRRRGGGGDTKRVQDNQAADHLCALLVQSRGLSLVTIHDFFALQCGISHDTPVKQDPQQLRSFFPDSPPATTAVLRHKRPKGSPVFIDTSGCRYNVVRCVSAKLGWFEAKPSQQGKVIWIDTSVSEARIARLPAGVVCGWRVFEHTLNTTTQHINHFPGMLLLCRKVDSARLLTKMKRMHPEAYPFVPTTYTDYDDFTRRGKAGDWYISKPDSGCSGKGIRLTNAPKPDMFENAVVQQYVANPLLIDNCKWDMRVYVLVLSVDPLKVYVYKEGLVRLCTEEYVLPTASNAQNALMHLTNYAIQKKTKKAQRPNHEDAEGTGCKRTFAYLFDYLKKQGKDPNAFWTNVEDLVVKSILAVKEHLKYSYRAAFPDPYDKGNSCFEILGFDVLCDENLQPWLLEVNHAPSFTCDSPLDFKVKAGVAEEALQLLGTEVASADKKAHASSRSSTVGGTVQLSTAEARQNAIQMYHKRKDIQEAQVARNYRRVFPSHDRELQASYAKVCAVVVFVVTTSTQLVESLEERQLPPQAFLLSPQARASAVAARGGGVGAVRPLSPSATKRPLAHQDKRGGVQAVHTSRVAGVTAVSPLCAAKPQRKPAVPLRAKATTRSVTECSSPVPSAIRNAHRRF